MSRANICWSTPRSTFVNYTWESWSLSPIGIPSPPNNLHFRFIFFQLVNVNVARLCRVSKIEICEFYGSLYNIIHIVYRCSQFQSTLVGNYEPMPASCSSFEAIFETVSVEWLLILVVNKNDTEMSSPRASSFLPGKKNYRVGTASFSTFEMDLPLLACIV